jgi:precorrin-2 methylase
MAPRQATPLEIKLGMTTPMPPDQMSSKAIARKIIKDYLAKQGATLECDMFIPISEAITAARREENEAIAKMADEREEVSSPQSGYASFAAAIRARVK